MSVHSNAMLCSIAVLPTVCFYTRKALLHLVCNGVKSYIGFYSERRKMYCSVYEITQFQTTYETENRHYVNGVYRISNLKQ